MFVSVISISAFPSPPWGGARGGGLLLLADSNTAQIVFTPTRPGLSRATLSTRGRARKAITYV